MDDTLTLEKATVEHLKGLFNFKNVELSSKDKRIIALDKARWITGKLTSKSFRKAKLDPVTEKDIFNKVKKCIDENKPIYLIILFGGYKHFWNQSYPEIDFAELFNLHFMADYVAPILAVHQPGVILDYESEDVIMWMDNYPETALDSYATSFKSLIKIFAKDMPANFKINYVRAKEQYDKNKLFARINELAPKRREEWAKLSKEELDIKLHRSPASVMWKGESDWSGLSEAEKEKKILESKIINETFYDADFELRGEYLNGDNHIPLVLSWGHTYENTANWLTIGSTYASSTDFWIGRGILEYREGKCVDRVVSHKQYDAIKDKLKIVKVTLTPLKNLVSIEVYNGKIDFND